MGSASTGDHHEFDQLAVQHVLGGLDRDRSSVFRDHLIGCTDCRSRVAELRGIAADLDVAAREERAMVRTKQPVEVVEEASEVVRTRSTIPGRIRNALLVLLSITLAIVAFWNIHLRQIEARLLESLEARAGVLDILVAGDEVPLLTVSPGLDVMVAATHDRVAVNADGLRKLSITERVVLWGIDQRGMHTVIAFVGEDGTLKGRLLMSGGRVGQVSIALTIETFPVPTAPLGEVLLEADLMPTS